MRSIGYIITRVMMDNWCVITIFELALGLSRYVSHSLLARGLQLSFTLIPSRPTALEFYCQCSFDLFDCVTINSLLPNSLWSVVKCDRFVGAIPLVWILSPIDATLHFNGLGIFDYISRPSLLKYKSMCGHRTVDVQHRWIIELTISSRSTTGSPSSLWEPWTTLSYLAN